MIEIDETIMNAYWREMEKFQALQADVRLCDKRTALESPSPNIKDMLAGLHKKHGKRRVAMFFANVVNGSYSDGRYSRETREWAEKQTPIPQNPQGVNYPDLREKPPGRFITDMHPTIVNLFAARIIQGEREAREKRKGVSR